MLLAVGRLSTEDHVLATSVTPLLGSTWRRSAPRAFDFAQPISSRPVLEAAVAVASTALDLPTVATPEIVPANVVARESAPYAPGQSRAVERYTIPGTIADCERCGDEVKFMARKKPRHVVCNVYVDGVWQRVEHYHLDCYDAVGQPHGEKLVMLQPLKKD